MDSLVKETRNMLGLSTEELAELMGVKASSAADLERDEKAGTASTRSILEALEAMVQKAATVAVAPNGTEAANRAAHRVALAVITTMDLEGQSVAPDVAQELYERALCNELVKLICVTRNDSRGLRRSVAAGPSTMKITTPSETKSLK